MAATGSWARILARTLGIFARDARGVSAIVFSMLLPVLVLVAGGVIDYASLSVQKEKLQAASDAAAIAAARELHLANVDPARLQPIAESVVNANLGDSAAGVVVNTSATAEPLSVTVDLRQDYSGFFTRQFMNTQLGAHSVARVSGGTALCVLALDDNARGQHRPRDERQDDGQRMCRLFEFGKLIRDCVEEWRAARSTVDMFAWRRRGQCIELRA